MAGYVKIVAGVAVLARPDLSRIGRDIHYRFVVAQQALNPTGAVFDIQRKNLVLKTVVVVFAAVVQLANGIDPVPLAYQLVPKAGRLALVCLGVGPAAGVVYVLASGQCGSGRHTDRRWGIGLTKTRSL